MLKKTTTELINNLKDCRNVESYFSDNNQELICSDLAAYLDELLKKHSLTKADVMKKSGLSKNYIYQIFSGLKTPSRDKVIALAFGFGLGIDETQQLLKHCFLMPLYPRNKRDCIILFGINNHSSIITVNTMLSEMELDLIE